MKNYKECSDTEFQEAMDRMREIKDNLIPIEDVPTDQLSILYTKLSADALQLSRIRTSYAMGLSIKTQKTVECLKAELIRRTIISR